MSEGTPDFFEGNDWLMLYLRHSDPKFLAQKILLTKDSSINLFSGKIELSTWIEVNFPLPWMRIPFWGSPVTTLFPEGFQLDDFDRGLDKVIHIAKEQKAFAIVVKDLPRDHPLEAHLLKAKFVPIEHDPIWYCKVPSSIKEFLATLSPGRRRGLRNRWNRFQKYVHVRDATVADINFIVNAYGFIWNKATMKLEKLTPNFLMETLLNKDCKMLIYELDNKPFGFTLLYQHHRIIFDKYIGAIPDLARKTSFWSMSIFYILDWAHKEGFEWYVAGQGGGAEKKALQFTAVPCKLWLKPVRLPEWLQDFLIKRLIDSQSGRIFTL